MPRGSGVVKYNGKRGVVWRIKYRDASGHQVMETVGAERDGFSKSDAESELRERLVKVERQDYRRPKPITLSEYAPRWLERRTVKNALKPTSVRAYRNSSDRLTSSKLGRMPLGAIRPRHVSEYIEEALKRLDPTTVNYDVSILAAIFKTAMGEEVVYANPAAVVERPKNRKKRWRILQPVEIARIVSEFKDERWRLVFLTAVLTGLRRHELQNLVWRDFDSIENTLRVRESKSEHGRRTVAIPPSLASALLTYRIEHAAFKGDDEYVFAHPRTGNRFNCSYFSEAFKKARARAGITDYMRPLHDLRHTSTTHDAAINSNLFAVKTKAGHKSLTMTQEYVHLAGQVFHEAAAALEERMLLREKSPAAGRKFYPSEPTSGDLADTEAA
jgi:integrase